MKRQNYWPSQVGNQVVWLNNWADNITGVLNTLGMGPAAAGTVADARYLVYVLGSWLPDVRSFSGAATSAVDILESGSMGASAYDMPVFTPPSLPGGTVAVAAGALDRIFKLVQQVKEANGYTEEMGQTLKIIGAEDTADHPTPAFSLKLGQGAGCQCVDILFTKFGHQGVYIESKRGSGGWEFLAIDTTKPYTDDRPLLNAAQPEVREYRLRFWDKGSPNGPWSEVQKITVAP